VPAEALVSLLATTLLVTGVILARLPVGQCAHCSHCAAEKLAKERDTEVSASRFYGIPLCAACGRHHSPGEPHRRS
jgi:hypothetical protein